MVASFPGVQYGQLFYRRCDNHKTPAIKWEKGNYAAKISLPIGCKEHLKWWIENVETEK